MANGSIQIYTSAGQAAPLAGVALTVLDENGAALQVNVGKSYVAIVGKDREGTLLFGGVSPTGVIGGEGASSDAQSGAAASAEPEL